ncbi:MAG: copper homeostasis membrane protein CopD [Rhodomicrobium sp.]
MSADLALAAARFIHYTALTSLFGGLLFAFYAGFASDRVRKLVRGGSVLAALAALASGVAWFLTTSATMADASIIELDRETLRFVLIETSFGQLWIVRLSLISTIVLLAVRISHPRQRRYMLTLLSAASLASLAGTGHAQEGHGLTSVVHIFADAAHLLAAGAWLGAFLPLLLALRPKDDLADAAAKPLRFSGVGSAAVAMLIGTGLINVLFISGFDYRGLISPYGYALFLKLTLFAGMLVFAAANRFWLVPALQARIEFGLSAERMRKQLYHHILGEQLLGLGVLAAVSWLGILSPAPAM